MSKLFRGVVSQLSGEEEEVLFPIVETTNSSTNGTSATSHTIDLPSGIASGNLLLIFWNGAANSSYTADTPSGWNSLYDATNGNLRARGAYRVSNGSEGSSVGVTFSAASRFSSTAYRISRYEATPAAGGAATGTSASPDPASLSHGFVGTDKVLWIAVSHSAAGGSISYPSGYSGGVSGYSGVFNNFHARTASAHREFESASENPGAFAVTDSVAWVARVVAIRGTTA